MTKEFIMHGRGFPKCFCCKRSLEISRDNIDDYICYNNRFYHRECFIKLYEPNEICNFCKKHMAIEKEIGTSVYYNGKFYHKDCFEKWGHDTKKPSKIRLAALENIDTYMEDADSEIDEILKENKDRDFNSVLKLSRENLQRKFDEMEVNAFIKNFYDIETLPSVIWKRLEALYNGTFQRFDGQIPPSDLLDMWQQKAGYLRKVNAALKTKSSCDSTGLIFYDLAILTSKYNDYVIWKQKQKTLEAETTSLSIESDKNIITSAILKKNQNAKNKTENNKEDNMSDLVDDIFGN